jgi:hypothetical protein
MSKENEENHMKMAKQCFNGTWDLLDKTDRTPEEDQKMIHSAHASRFHWGEIGTPVNFARGDWQISRVYAVLNMGRPALKYGKSSLKICLDNGIGDFDLAFGYEAVARAYAVQGDAENLNKYKNQALEAAKSIKKDEDREYFLSELNTVELKS